MPAFTRFEFLFPRGRGLCLDGHVKRIRSFRLPIHGPRNNNILEETPYPVPASSSREKFLIGADPIIKTRKLWYKLFPHGTSFSKKLHLKILVKSLRLVKDSVFVDPRERWINTLERKIVCNAEEKWIGRNAFD